MQPDTMKISATNSDFGQLQGEFKIERGFSG